MRAIGRNNRTGFIFISLTFLFFLLFFTKIHPIVISTIDDYYAFANHRHVLPEWRGSNPIRVFAEVFMPLVSQGSGLFFRVFGGNIFDYLTFGWGFCVAGAVTALTAVLYRMFRKMGVPSLQACAGLIIFLLMHFWIFKQRKQDGNTYMLHTVYACTYFYYVIPDLLNAILVLWLHMDRDVHELFRPGKYLKKAWFLFLAYFCIFSNIWASAILASYLGVRLVKEIISGIREKKKCRAWIAENYVIVMLAVVWLVSQVLEMNGLRAAGVEVSIADTFGAVWQAAVSTMRSVNLRYALFCGLVIAGGLASLFVRKDRKTLGLLGKTALSLVLFIVYLLLSCSKTGAYYVRPDVFYGAFFFGAVIVLICLFELLKRFPAGKLILPFLLLFILVDCNSMGKTYQDSIVSYRGSIEVHNRINADILAQLKEAEAQGRTETKLYVPDCHTSDNWPYAVYADEQIAKGFYKLGALKDEIRITEIVPTQEKNAELNCGY